MNDNNTVRVKLQFVLKNPGRKDEHQIENNRTLWMKEREKVQFKFVPNY